MLKRLQQKDGGRPQRGGQERGDMENQEADQKFRSCPWVSKQREASIDLRVGQLCSSIVAGVHGVDVGHRYSRRLDKCGRIWEWLA